MTRTYDLVVLGAGMAAVSAAAKCAAAGWSVAVVDELPYGGTCALRGCDPKKILRRGAEIVDAARLMHGKGVQAERLEIDWSALVDFKRSFTERMPERIEDNLKRKGVATIHGSARFVNENTVEVDGETRLQGRYMLVATGAKPRPLDIPGSQYLTDSTAFMELDELPKRVLLVGGGYVSFEFAHLAARAGCKVCIIDRGARPLKAFDSDLVEMLIDRSHTAGIELRRGTAPTFIEKTGDGYTLGAEQNGERVELSTDLIVHGAGRIPAVDRLDLAAAGIESTDDGVCVSEFLQSISNPSVYAAGDAADTPGAPLTPVAVFEAKVAASNIMNGNGSAPDYRGVPSVVFTIPELARVGMTEAEAKAAGQRFRVAFNETGSWYSNFRVGESCAATKVLVGEDSGQILGAHLLGPEYAEVVNIFGMAIRLSLGVEDLKKAVGAYPTVGSDIGSML